LKEGIEGSRLVVYPGVGHAVYWEEPSRIALDIVAFIKKNVR
jgi:pimeloyl-ACP methyl ester carboxylesterase